jgi:hypothetical protein
MASKSESGHPVNVTNFEKLKISCESYGDSYNPSKESLKLPAIGALYTATINSVAALEELNAARKNATTARASAFKPVDELITRVGNALKASDTTAEVDATAQSIIRKIKGQRATPKKTEEQKKAAAEKGIVTNEISVSQMSYDSRVDNLGKLTTMLSAIPPYNPNENDLKTSTLIALYNDLKAKNTAVVMAETQLSKARIARNEIMYKPITGLVDIAADVKTYVKSVFGATSPQYKQITGLKFVNYSN